jgi:hypothetical protein
MATLVRIDPETLPRVLILDPPVSDAEFETLCRDNPDLRLERTREGAVRMNPPTGGWTSSGNEEISSWKAHRLTGDRKGTWSLSVTANLRLTFRIDASVREIREVNLEDYH